MATIHCSKTGLVPAAAYVRMSGHRQERSPAQQRAEIEKLAAREGCRIDYWFQDDAITGDSGPQERPGFKDALEAAQQGKYQRLLAYDQDRIGRFDSIDAGQWMAPLRASGVVIVTCVQGRIDWTTFEGRIIYTVNQEGKKKFLEELSGKVVRGKIDNAKAGGHNGGPAVYGMERGLFENATGRLVRRLLPGEAVRMEGHRVHLLPSSDTVRIEAVRFAFQRFDAADMAIRDLARELEAKGYPSPTDKGWTHHNVANLLRTRAYVGTARWGATAWGKYHTAQGKDIATVNGSAKRGRRHKPEEDAIAVENAHEGIIDRKLFDRVQRKLKKREKHCRHSRHTEYPLAGLIYCGHCQKPMYGNSLRAKDRHGNVVYRYAHYVCSTYANHGRGSLHSPTCGRHPVDADRVLRWLVHKLQEVFLGPGRETLVKQIRSRLQAQAQASKVDTTRLEKRAADLDREVARLVKAIRTIDAAELVEELQLVRTERDRVRAELAQAGQLTDAGDLDTEAEQIADQLWTMAESLTEAEPAVLREVLRRFVSRITCRWEPCQGRGRTRCRLVEGRVELREQTPFSVFGEVAQAP